MNHWHELLRDAAHRGADYLQGLDCRAVAPSDQAVDALRAMHGPLPESGTEPAAVLRELDEVGSPATMASAGGRYFGFVIGGGVPAAVAANMLAAAWDQCVGMRAASPAGAMIEDIVRHWLLDLLRLPADCAVGLTTGATMANFVGLAAARHALLARQGWQVEEQGLYGAPPLRVIVGEEVHVSVLKALGMLGLGSERVLRVPADDQGRMRPDQLPELDERTVVCVQAGNVNTGAFDAVGRIARAAGQAGAWTHVDGAFGLWARSTRTLDGLCQGLDRADSWAADAHKWLNVPYDCGVAIVRDCQAHGRAMGFHAPYLEHGSDREPAQFTPEMSRRARGIEVYAALRQLGRQGIAQLIDRNCAQARRFAEGLAGSGFEVLNDVVLNQVLVSCGSDALTDAVIQSLQREGTLWAGGTTWRGRRALRLSVSSWRTTDHDVERSLAAIVGIAKQMAKDQAPGSSG